MSRHYTGRTQDVSPYRGDDGSPSFGGALHIDCGVSTARYEIHIKGRVGDDVAAVFEGLTADVLPVETVLHGDIRDQAELHGILDQVQGLGLELIEVRRLPDDASKPVRTGD